MPPHSLDRGSRDSLYDYIRYRVLMRGSTRRPVVYISINLKNPLQYSHLTFYGGRMNEFNITTRIDECYENGFDELLTSFNGIMLSIIETEVPQYHFKAELMHWCYHVDHKLEQMREEREKNTQLTADNILTQSSEVFGTEV